MPIGPELPAPVLDKRKRVDENPDEIPVSDSDSSRSSSPDTSAKRQRTTGPTLPSSTPGDNKAPRTVGHSLPESAESAEVNSTEPPSNPKHTSTSRVLGPTLPPAPLDERPPQVPSDSDSDDDDDFGPSLPPSSNAPSSTHAEPPTTTTTTTASTAPQRDEWMTLAPSTSDWSSRSIDPTKLKSRRFATNPRGSSNPPSSTSATNTWHETLAEKQERLRREVLGISQPPTSSSTTTSSNTGPTTTNSQKEKDEEISKRMAEYHAQRGGSLFEKHQNTGKGREEEDDPSKRAFDYEKDVARGLGVNGTQRREMVKKMKDMGGRFGKAGYL